MLKSVLRSPESSGPRRKWGGGWSDPPHKMDQHLHGKGWGDGPPHPSMGSRGDGALLHWPFLPSHGRWQKGPSALQPGSQLSLWEAPTRGS